MAWHGMGGGRRFKGATNYIRLEGEYKGGCDRRVSGLGLENAVQFRSKISFFRIFGQLQLSTQLDPGVGLRESQDPSRSTHVNACKCTVNMSQSFLK
jgi:hypothetical protein